MPKNAYLNFELRNPKETIKLIEKQLEEGNPNPFLFFIDVSMEYVNRDSDNAVCHIGIGIDKLDV